MDLGTMVWEAQLLGKNIPSTTQHLRTHQPTVDLTDMVAVRLQLTLEINMMAPQPETLNQARQTVQLMVVVVVMMETMTGHKFMALA